MSADDARFDHVTAPSTARPLSRLVATALLAGALLATTALSACATAVPGRAAASPLAASPSTGAVELPTDTQLEAPVPDPAVATHWIDAVCGSLVTLNHATTRKPAIDGSSPTSVTSGLVRYLDGLEDAIDTASSDLEADRPSPLTGGDAFLTALADSLSTVRSAMEQTKANLRKGTPHSRAALEKAIEPLMSVDDQLGPIDQLEAGDADIDDAAADAPNCQELERLVSAGDGFSTQGI